MLRARSLVAGTALAVLAVAVGSVFAATINGTARNDKLIGTQGADTMYGKAGNDTISGLGGDDVLIGGTGNDRLVGGSGADVLRCGPGNDVATRDVQDTVARDCEVVRGPKPAPPAPTPAPPPAPPPPPPVATVTAGAYQGLIEGNFLFFDVADRTITRFRLNYIREDCDQGGIYVYGTMGFGSTRYPIADDGTFAFARDSTGTVSGQPARFHNEVAGRFTTATTATGTLLASVEYDRQGVHLKCTSGQRPWTASLQP